MKKLLTLTFLVCAFAFNAEAQFKFGVQGAVSFDNTTFIGAGAKGHYTINDQFAGQASFTYFFEDVTVWSLDLDVHYSGFDIGDVESFALTPFAGLNIFQVSVGGFGSASTTGLNAGLNGTMPLSDSMDFFVEPKIIIGGAGSFMISAGVYF